MDSFRVIDLKVKFSCCEIGEVYDFIAGRNYVLSDDFLILIIDFADDYIGLVANETSDYVLLNVL